MRKMGFGELKKGDRAITNKAIGNLPAGSVVKIVEADKDRVIISAVYDGLTTNYQLSTFQFRQDFELMINFFSEETPKAVNQMAKIIAPSRISCPNLYDVFK